MKNVIYIDKLNLKSLFKYMSKNLIKQIELLIDKPNSPQPYRELEKYFQSVNRTEDAKAIKKLVEKKLNKC